jgi:hypothetical protein
MQTSLDTEDTLGRFMEKITAGKYDVAPECVAYKKNNLSERRITPFLTSKTFSTTASSQNCAINESECNGVYSREALGIIQQPSDDSDQKIKFMPFEKADCIYIQSFDSLDEEIARQPRRSISLTRSSSPTDNMITNISPRDILRKKMKNLSHKSFF